MSSYSQLLSDDNILDLADDFHAKIKKDLPFSNRREKRVIRRIFRGLNVKLAEVLDDAFIADVRDGAIDYTVARDRLEKELPRKLTSFTDSVSLGTIPIPNWVIRKAIKILLRLFLSWLAKKTEFDELFDAFMAGISEIDAADETDGDIPDAA